MRNNSSKTLNGRHIIFICPGCHLKGHKVRLTWPNEFLLLLIKVKQILLDLVDGGGLY